MLHASKFFVLISACLLANIAMTQDSVNLSNLSMYRNPAVGWQMAGDIVTDIKTVNSFKIISGTNILVNQFSDQKKPVDLYSLTEHGDADIEFDYMMARGSNSGIYLQGNYEIQLFDSWGKTNVTSADNGGVYQRWDEARGAGRQGFEGTAPRQAVSKAPGLWQHLKISFRAPVFDAAGSKISNAKILRAELNGVLIQEQVELTGPTHGGDGKEKATGPVRLQGDHGAVAFRNIIIRKFDQPLPVLTNLQYAVYKTASDRKLQTSTRKPVQGGKLDILSASINNLADTFLLQYKGTLKIAKAGNYQFKLATAAGLGSIYIDNKEISFFKSPFGRTSAELPAGELPFEIRYSKSMDWAKPSIGLQVSGPGIREFVISDQVSTGGDQVDPILINANTNTVLRSFVDIPGKRIVHAISVGSPEGTHYTYDADHGAIVQAWHGGFLDATPMWHERGDGSSRATGSLVYPELSAINITRAAPEPGVWKSDTLGTGFRPNGYRLDNTDRPYFRYTIYGRAIQDSIWLPGDGSISRQISLASNTAYEKTRAGNTGIGNSAIGNSGTGYSDTDNPGTGNSGTGNINEEQDFSFRLAVADSITINSDNTYIIGDKKWYLKIEDPSNTNVSVRKIGGRQELIAVFRKQLRYTIIF